MLDHSRLRFFILFFLFSLIASAWGLPLEKIKLPPGFRIGIFASKVKGARSLALGSQGTLFVGTRQEGLVYAIKNGKVMVIAKNLNLPNGVAFNNGNLYVAEVNRVIRFSDIESRLQNPPKAQVVNSSFPSDRHHGWKFIRFGPDGMLYVPVGAPCNVCERSDPYATIMSMYADGSSLKVFARGVRNSVGFDFHPAAKELWFTDNGRDGLGDNIPPDELNRAPTANLNFGFPYVYGSNVKDPEFGNRGKNLVFTPPAKELAPHTAALGMRFYTGKMFPQEYLNQIFIAEHGSWDRSEPLGYRVTLVKLDSSHNPSAYEVFAEGWLQNGQSWGRPVDVEVLPDGSLLVSDDKAGVIYRIAYSKGGK